MLANNAVQKLQGNLHKMHTEIGNPVRYSLELGGQRVVLSDYLGDHLRIEYLQQIECVHCGRITKKSFNQGFCYPCFISLAQCDRCIMSPENCHYHLGTCREPDWGLANCMRAHIIYLSNTSGVKVGITRESQLPTRWIDQGAVRALPIIRVTQRYHAGLIEHAFRQHVSDRTNWRNMLKNEVEDIDLYAVFEKLWPQILPELDAELIASAEAIAAPAAVLDLHYPALQYPEKVSSFNLDKEPLVEGRLDAIKGQYLILDGGVINIRKYGGYLVNLECGD
jgi:hypothetical protein